MADLHKDNGGWLPGYRGFVDHGVDAPDYSGEESGWAETPGLTHFEKAPEEVPPIAVKVISDPTPRYVKDWRVANAVVSGNAQLIVGMQETRKSLKIRNNDAANPVYISPDSSPSPFLSWRLAAGAEISLTAITDVWAIADTGNMVNISVLTEYEVEK